MVVLATLFIIWLLMGEPIKMRDLARCVKDYPMPAGTRYTGVWCHPSAKEILTLEDGAKVMECPLCKYTWEECYN